jgi:hypothetical protein
MRRRVAARSPMSAASLPATQAAGADVRRLSGPIGPCNSSGAGPTCRHPDAILRRAVGHRRACASLIASFAAGEPCAKPDLERITAIFTPLFSSPLSVAPAPALCGAFVDERRVVAATWAAACGRETLIRPWRTVRLPKAGCRVMGFGVRASVSRVAAAGSRFPPSDPVREVGARTDNALFADCQSRPGRLHNCNTLRRFFWTIRGGRS